MLPTSRVRASTDIAILASKFAIRCEMTQFRLVGRYLISENSVNPLTPNDHYSGRTAPLTSKRCILYIYSANIGTEYFKHGIYSPFFSLQNIACFIILTYLVPILFTFIYRVC